MFLIWVICSCGISIKLLYKPEVGFYEPLHLDLHASSVYGLQLGAKGWIVAEQIVWYSDMLLWTMSRSSGIQKITST